MNNFKDSGMKNSSKGFTLIELMIVVAIIGILSYVAYPSYQESVTKTKRADAKSSLMDRAAAFERCFSMNGQYNYTAAASPQPAKDCTAVLTATANTLLSTASTKGYYTIAMPTLTATTFTLTAAPNGFSDPKCTLFTLTQTGLKTATGTLGNACW